MIIKITLEHQNFEFDTRLATDISIPLRFNDKQPNIYGVSRASSKAYEAGEVIGDTRQGGSCNFDELKLIPHCNGTHTECIGHITHERIPVHKQLKDSLIPVTLLSVWPEDGSDTDDHYDPPLENGDMLISRKVLEASLQNAPQVFLKGLIIRTLPNDDSKLSRDYTRQKPPFFSLEAMELLCELGVKHLLVDLPSVDRAQDEGKLSVHHLFWKVKPGSHETDAQSLLYNTITEMIYVPPKITDGSYLLNLQIAPFVSDASPSRPVLYPLIEN